MEHGLQSSPARLRGSTWHTHEGVLDSNVRDGSPCTSANQGALVDFSLLRKGKVRVGEHKDGSKKKILPYALRCRRVPVYWRFLESILQQF